MQRARMPLGWLRPVVVVTAAVMLVSMAEAVSPVAPVAVAAPAAQVERVGSRPDRASAALAARAQGSRVKVDGDGSVASETFANADGSLTAETYTVPSFRRGGAKRDGTAWVPLSPVLTGTGAEADPFVADGLARRVTLGRAAGRVLAVDVPGGSVSFSASGLRLGASSRSGSTVSFADAAADTDLQLVVTPAGVKTNLVLRSAAAPRSFRFHLSDPKGLVGAPEQQPDGSFRFDRDLGDGYRLSLAPATAYVPAEIDPEIGPGVDRSSATQTVTRAGDGWDIDLAVAAEWLAGKAFPVVLDPSPTFVAGGPGTPGVDCHLVSGTSSGTSFCASDWREVGYNSGVSKVIRTLAMFGTSSIPSNAVVSAADLDLYLYSTSGPTGPVAVRAHRMTASWGQGATWNSNASTYDSGVTLATTNVGLAAGHYHWALTPGAVQNWVSGAVANYGLMLKVVSEGTPGVLRFNSAFHADTSRRPRLTVTYNTPPSRPMDRGVQPCAAQCASPVLTSSLTPTLTAQSSDADGGTLRYDFEVWWGSSSSPTTLVTSGSVPNAPSGVPVRWKVPVGALNSTDTYEYRVRTYDGALFSPWSAGWTVFNVDPYPPSALTVESPSWTDGGWGGPTSGTIQFSSTDSGGSVTGYSTQLDDAEWSDFNPGTIRSLGGLTEGRHTYSIRAQDRAGNVSATTTWSIGVNNGGIDSPQVEARTAARVDLRASALTGKDWLTWKYRLGSTGTFVSVPLADVTLPGTSTHPSAWPVQRSGGVLPPLVWDVAATAGPDGLVQLQACFGTSAADPAPFCVAGRNVQLSRAAGAYASSSAGPGSVSLLTGDLTVSESDVDVPSYSGSLSIGRTLTTLSPSTVVTGATGVFGPAWTASMPGPEAGAADVSVLDKTANGYIALVREDGTQDIYDQYSTSGTTTTYLGVGEAGTDGAALVKDTAPTPDTLTLTDLDGTKTVWALSGSSWGIASVTEAGNPATAPTTTYTRDGSGRVTQILAPVPALVSCASASTTPGCRTLKLTYSTATSATGTAPGQWGTYVGRLEKVEFAAYDPAAPTSHPTPLPVKVVAQYEYDSTGLLRAAWDPRITPSPLKTTYSYGASNRLTTVTPPGLSAWTLGYDGTNRLTTVTRPNPTGGTQTTTVRYGVPFTGAGAPLELGGTETAKWGQSDLPTTATAVWGPDRVPAATPSATDWQYAALSYLDVNGRAVNTADWGANAWQVATTGYDKRGNTVRALSAGNRNDALNPTANPDLDPYVAGVPTSAARAVLLSDITVYSADGVDELESFGPMHPVVLDDGTLVSAREHSKTTYDVTYRLPTASVTTAQTPDGAEKDTRTTLTGYDPIVGGDPSGWDLREATSTTTDMPGATPDIVNKTRYNAAGQTIETRKPSDPGGTGAGTTRTTYYTAAPGSGCAGKPHWAGLTCQTAPAAQPGTGPALPVTTTTYNIWDAPDTVTETAGTTIRTTTMSFDAAGRSTTQSVTVTPAGAGGTDIPTVTTGYTATTGLPTTTTTSAGVITVGYDAVGQATTYTQTSGGTTITTATRTYDIAGRVATVADGKGTTTYSYDSATDHRGNAVSAVDTLAGTMTASYDADGGADVVTYPGGLTATTADDNAGNDIRLTYAKTGATWMTFTQTESIHGQVRNSTGPASRQLNTYDAAARLTSIDDLAGTGCTRRGYAFDANTNRTGLTTTGGIPLAIPAATALCDLTGATPTTVTSAYDTADRLTGTGITYDTLGRTTALPAGAVTGGAALTIGYATNDMVNTLTQNGRTKTYTLDPARRILTTADTTGPTLTNHYTAGDDNPAWIDSTDGAWTRYLPGPSGGLAASVTNTGTIELQLANLHGDIVATAGTTSTGPATYTEATEYGLPREASTGSRYGWLGSHRRNTGDTLAQITLMGVRLYNPVLGRFLSVDPVTGGSCNNYDYVCADPINALDLDGKKCWTCSAKKWGRRAWKYKSQIATVALAGACVLLTAGTCLVASLALTAAQSYGDYRRGRFSYKRTAANLAWTLTSAYGGKLISGGGRSLRRGWMNRVRQQHKPAYHHRGAGGRRRAPTHWGQTRSVWKRNAVGSAIGYAGSYAIGRMM